MHSFSRMFPRVMTMIVVAGLSGPMDARGEDVLLIPNSASDNIMAFDPADGALLDAAFIPDPGVVESRDVFQRPLNAIDSGRGTILVSDQFSDAVLEFGFDGSYLGIFSNNGTIDTTVLDNVRGIAMLADGRLLVCNSGSGIVANANAVVPFDAAGAQAGQFIFQRYGGIEGPFDALVLSDKILVTSDGRDFIARYTTDGKFDDIFTRSSALNFPQQMTLTSRDTILVAVFSGGFIAEYDQAGAPVAFINPPGLSGYRGVCELDNGNLLVTTSSGVQEITRTNLVVQTEFSGSEMRYIERVTLPPGMTRGAIRAAGLRRTPTESNPVLRPVSVSAEDERGAS